MNISYINQIIRTLPFPEEARTSLLSAANTVHTIDESDFLRAVSFYRENSFSYKETEPLLEIAADKTGIPLYTINLLMLLSCLELLEEEYKARGIDRQVFLDTASDFCCKAQECYTVHGVWGCFVTAWYTILFKVQLFKLGRLEYQIYHYNSTITYNRHGIYLDEKTPVLALHIPSGAPLPEEECLASYSLAADFFKDFLIGGVLPCTCSSWLLHPSTEYVLSPSSNIITFASHFDIVQHHDQDSFSDAWRVFGRDAGQPAELLPENTSMQRAYKRYLLSGGKTGSGFGVLLFDGNKVITGSQGGQAL